MTWWIRLMEVEDVEVKSFHLEGIYNMKTWLVYVVIDG
jgi:hypothetical protein